MQQNAAFFHSLLEQLNDAVYIVDAGRRISFWNKAAERLTGYTRQEVVGTCCGQSILRHADQGGAPMCSTECPLRASLETGATPELRHVSFRHKDGHRVPVLVRAIPMRDEQGRIVGAAEVFTADTTREQLHVRLAELEKLALLDPLTNLPNRRYLEAQLAGRLDEMKRYEWPFGVVFLDVDQFKRVNDQYGHGVGDEVLKVVSRTLSASSRLFDTTGRWGGDEFMAVVANVGRKDLVDVAERFRTLVSSASLDEPKRVTVTVSVGAALAQPGDSVQSLAGRADEKLYEAKRGGRNRVCA